jgi:hypothetical protein
MIRIIYSDIVNVVSTNEIFYCWKGVKRADDGRYQRLHRCDRS